MINLFILEEDKEDSDKNGTKERNFNETHQHSDVRSKGVVSKTSTFEMVRGVYELKSFSILRNGKIDISEEEAMLEITSIRVLRRRSRCYQSSRLYPRESFLAFFFTFSPRENVNQDMSITL